MDGDESVMVISAQAIGAAVPAGPGSRMLVGPAHLGVHESVEDEMVLSSVTSGEHVGLLRSRDDGSLSMRYSGTSPHYNDGQRLMSTPVDMSVAAVLLDVEPEELTPVVAAAGRALGQARDPIAGWQPDGPPQALSFAQAKAIASGEQVDASPPAAARARASFEAGGSAVADALARLQASRPTSRNHEDRPHRSHGGPSIR